MSKLQNTLRNKLMNPYYQYMAFLSHIGKPYTHQQDVPPPKLILVTVAFNMPILIQYQIEYIKKYLQDKDYQLIVADNSTKETYRKEISKICEENGIEYIPIPKYINKLHSSKLFFHGASHGAALNWLFYHVISVRKPMYFAFIDHDIIPFSPTSLLNHIEKDGIDFYGDYRKRGKGWYIWPGYCIFRYEIMERYQPNFLPMLYEGVYFDSGGSNHKNIYRYYPLEASYFAKNEQIKLKKTEGLTKWDQIYHADYIQIIDNDWVHIINGSNYAQIPGKEQTVKKILHNLERIKKLRE